ncbi:MAG: von Willebrand factor type A domain-containing protein [Chloroflexota bacterium]
MNDQMYTPEESALKAAIEQAVEQIEPDAVFVDNLKTELMDHPSLHPPQKETPPVNVEKIIPLSNINSAPPFSLFPLLAFSGFTLVAAPTSMIILTCLGFFIATRIFFGTGKSANFPITVSLIEATPKFHNGETLTIPQVVTTPTISVVEATVTPQRNEAKPTSISAVTATLPLVTATPSPPPQTQAAIESSSQHEKNTTPIVILIATDTPPLVTATPSPPPQIQTALETSTQEIVSIPAQVSTVEAPILDEPVPRFLPQTGGKEPLLLSASPDSVFFQDQDTGGLIEAQRKPISSFGLSVDTDSYGLARSYLTEARQLPPPLAIRPEEFINYFQADYPPPALTDPAFAIHLDAAPSPFGDDEFHLLRVGIQGRVIEQEKRDPVLLILVIDTSSSMQNRNRLELVKQTIASLVDQLGEQDRVGVVVYSDRSWPVLAPTQSRQKDIILAATNILYPGQSNNVNAGLKAGYQMATQAKKTGENVHIILLSDGVTNTPEMVLSNPQTEIDQQITLSTIGVGMGNYNDVLMERLANDGDGNYFYIDNLQQARRVFVHNLMGTLQVIGHDAKIQIEFNPAVVTNYRLIGYENRAMANEDFRRDRLNDQPVDAGEVGAGHSVTALYEITLKGDETSPNSWVATARIRWLEADTDTVIETSQVISTSDLKASINDAPASFRLHAAVAEFAELLRQSPWSQSGSFSQLAPFAAELENDFPDSLQVTEFIQLIQSAAQHKP